MKNFRNKHGQVNNIQMAKDMIEKHIHDDVCKQYSLNNEQETVNHPSHYNESPAKCSACAHPIECIDVVRHRQFNIGNAIKYLWRWEHKGGIEDLKKAIWYINDEINRIGGRNESN